jgi:hypothetical protein
MRMKRISLLIASHALLLAAGFGWHRAVAGRQPGPPPPARQEIPLTTKPVEREPGSVTTVMGEAPWTGAECRKAWHALKGSGIPPAEITALRQRILREWAMRDLRPALIAWSDLETLNATEISNSLQRAFDGHEEEMLEWIKSGDFGLDGSELLFALTNRMTYKNPALLMKLMPGIPEDFQERVLQNLFGSHSHPGPDEAAMNERIAGIAGLPDERLQSLAWQAALKGMANRGEDRFHDILARNDLPADVRPAALKSFAEGIARNAEPAKALEQFRKLSPEDQSAVGPALLDQAKTYSFARPSAVTNALTMLAKSGQWQLLAQSGPEAVEHFFKSSKPNPEAVSRWALQIPARAETAETFRAAIGPRFRQDLLQGAQWARSLPAGWHRDQALAQLAIIAGIHHKDPATRDAAMAEITDPGIQKELREWLQNQPATR